MCNYFYCDLMTGGGQRDTRQKKTNLMPVRNMGHKFTRLKVINVIALDFQSLIICKQRKMHKQFKGPNTCDLSFLISKNWCLVAQSCVTLCDHMDCSIPGFPVLHHLPKFVQTHVH